MPTPQDIFRQPTVAGLAEVSSRQIGEMVIEQLRDLDHIAYIRFASVYREFADLDALKEELETLEAVGSRAGLEQQPPLIPEEDLESLARPPAWRALRRRGGQRRAGTGGPSQRLPAGRKDAPLSQLDETAQENPA